MTDGGSYTKGDGFGGMDENTFRPLKGIWKPELRKATVANRGS